MDIKIVTEDQLKDIDEYIKEKEFWKSGTGEVVKETFIALVSYGMDSDVAINNIVAICNAMSDEYGD